MIIKKHWQKGLLIGAILLLVIHGILLFGWIQNYNGYCIFHLGTDSLPEEREQFLCTKNEYIIEVVKLQARGTISDWRTSLFIILVPSFIGLFIDVLKKRLIDTSKQNFRKTFDNK